MTTLRKTEQIDRLGGLFEGIESFDRTTQSMGVDVGKAFPNGADENAKKRYANITFMAFAKKSRPADVAPTWDLARNQYAQQAFGVDAPDDATFYNLVGQHFAKEKATRAIASEMSLALMEKAVSGGDFLESYNGLLGEARKKPGYDNADLSVLHEFARKTWNDSTAKAEQLAPLIDRVETFYASSGGFDEGIGELTTALSSLSPQDARFVIDTAAARQKRVAKAAGGQDKPMKLGAIVASARVGRFGGRLWTSAKEEIIPTANIFPWWDKEVADESQHQEAIKRRLRQNQTGELDPLKADSWFGERMLEAADNLPYMLAASNPSTMPLVVLSLKNEARTGLIDEGVDPETANKISTVAGPLMAAIEMVQSKIAFQNMKFAGTSKLKKDTIAAVARRLTTRTAGALAGEIVTENLQDMTAPVMQELWSKFDDAVPDPSVSDKFKEFWKKSPEMAVSFLPLVLIGSAGATRQDVQLFKADTMVRDRLLAVGVTPAEVDEVVQASTVGRIAFSEAIKRVSKNADVRSAEAKAAQDRVQAEIDANNTPEGYDANFNGRGNLEVTTADGNLVTEASSAPEAQQAIRDNEFKKLLAEEDAARAALDKTEVQSAGDVANDPLPERPPSSPREDLDAWNKTGEEYTAEIAAAKQKPANERLDAIQAVADKYGKLRESLKNRHFGGENPSKEILAGLKQGKTPAQVQRPDAEAPKVDAETAVREPTPAPDRDGTPPVPTAVALNHKEIETARETFNRAKLNKEEREKHAYVLNQVKIDGSWTGAYDEAKRILAENDLPDLKTHMQFLVYVADAENRRLSLLSEAEQLRKDGDVNKAGAKELQADAIRTEIDVIETAAYHGGSRLGKALNARRRALDRKQYELAPLLQRARRKVPDINNEQELELGRMAQQVLELQAEIVRLEQTLAAKQAEADQEEAGNFVEEGIRSRTRARKENAQSRRAALKKQLQALGYRTNIVSDGSGFSAEAMSAIAGIAETYIDEGAATLWEVSGKLKADIPDLSDQDIFNALGRRNKKATKKILDETEARIKELKTQAKLWGDIHDALNGIFKEGAEQLAGSQQVQALREILAKLRLQANKSMMDAAQIANVEAAIARVTDQMTGGFRYIPETKERRAQTVQEKELRAELKRLETMMRTDDAILNLQDQLRRLREGDPSATQLSAREKRVVTDTELEDRRIKMRQLKRKIDNRIEEMRKKTGLERVVDALLSPRAFQSTADMSAIARQGVMLVARDIFSKNLGRNVGRSVGAYWQAMMNESNYDGIALAMENHPRYKELVRMGIEFQELDGTPNQRDEHFMTNLAEKVPGFGKIVRGGNRGMITFLNLMRFSAGEQFLEAYPDASTETKERMASLINKLSGRGNLGNAKAFTKELNVIFYAPKYAISRYQVLWAPIVYRNDKTVLREWTKYMGSFAAFTATIFTMAIGAGFDVDDDPQSGDFLKVRAGRVRYDALGGMQQPLRLLFLTAYSAGHRDERYADPLDTGLQFFKFKLNPAVTVPEQLITGKDWRNQPISSIETLARSITPIILQETADALVNTPEQAPAVAATSFIGVGATVYDEKKSTRKGKAQP